MARMALDERREQLVEAAIRVMTRDGVAKATTRAIVAEAGVSLSVFHYCFDSKQTLLESVIRTITQHSASQVMAAIEPRGTVLETVRSSLQVYWDHVMAHPGEHMLTYELTQYALRKPGFEDVAQVQYRQYLASNTAFLDHLRTTTGLEPTWPVDGFAHYLAVFLDGLTLQWLVLRDDDAAAAVLDHVAEQIVAVLRQT